MIILYFVFLIIISSFVIFHFDFMNCFVGYNPYVLQHYRVHSKGKEPFPAKILSVQHGMTCMYVEVLLHQCLVYLLFVETGGEAKRTNAQYHSHGAYSEPTGTHIP